jgi:hypothetical protein
VREHRLLQERPLGGRGALLEAAVRWQGELDVAGGDEDGAWPLANRGLLRQGRNASHVTRSVPPSGVTSPDSIVYTDDYPGYNGLECVYYHHSINHTHKVYVDGHVHTRPSRDSSRSSERIRGVYHVVSEKWLQGYLNEYACATTIGTIPARCSRRCCCAQPLVKRGSGPKGPLHTCWTQSAQYRSGIRTAQA